MKYILPKADTPIIQLSINKNASPQEIIEVGKKLRPLRNQGWLLMGSGNIVHNLRKLNWSFKEDTKEADEFDAFIKDSILSADYSAIANYKGHPAAHYAVPIVDHFYPLLYILGAIDENEKVEVFNEDRLLGAISMTSYLFK